MKIFAKKDGKLINLGEGKIYSKKELTLKEDVSGFEKAAPNISVAARDAATKLSANPNLKDVAGSADDLTTGLANGVTKDPTITTDVKSPESIKMTQNLVNKMSPDEKENTDIQFVDGTKSENNGMVNSSVAPKKTMDEMRRNSVPFTKTELTEFLKSI